MQTEIKVGIIMNVHEVRFCLRWMCVIFSVVDRKSKVQKKKRMDETENPISLSPEGASVFIFTENAIFSLAFIVTPFKWIDAPLEPRIFLRSFFPLLLCTI